VPRTTLVLSDSDVLAVFRFRLQGWTLAQLAERFGASRSYIGDVLAGRRRASVAPDDLARAAVLAQRRGRSEAVLASAVREYMGGWSIRDAGRKWGVKPTTLHRELLRKKIRRRASNAKGK
jgi:transcriptional regulator with XRE-family HTH domain